MNDRSTALRAIRGATTVDRDDPTEIRVRVGEMLASIVEQNQVRDEDVVSCFLTATTDITTMFPATAAREFGWHDVPLLGSAELDVVGATPLCIRVLVHVTSPRSRDEIDHVYLHGARDLRADAPGR